MNQQLQAIYEKVMNGDKRTYNDMVEIVSQLSQLVPELNINYGQGINKYTKDQLERIVQQSQINKNLSTGTEKYQDVRRKQNENFNESQWLNKYQQYYNDNKNNLKELPQILNIDQNYQKVYDKIYQSFFQLGLLEDVIYNREKYRFELIHFSDRNGQCAMKLTLPLFKKIIQLRSGIKLKNTMIDQFGRKIDLSIQNFITNESKKLHFDTINSVPCKYIIQIFKKMNMDKKATKLNKVMKRNLIVRDNLTPNQTANKLFKKFQSLGKQRKNTTTYQSQRNDDIQNQLDSKQIKDVFLPLKVQGNGNIQVLDTGEKAAKDYQNKKQEKLSDKLLRNLKYIPNKDDPQSILQTSTRMQNLQALEKTKQIGRLNAF